MIRALLASVGFGRFRTKAFPFSPVVFEPVLMCWIRVGVPVPVGVWLSTITVTFAAVPTFPAASRALADRTCVPLATGVVSQLIEYGAVFTSEPRFMLSS